MIQHQATPSSACLRPTNPKATGSNPVGRTHLTIKSQASSEETASAESFGAGRFGTLVGQSEPPRQAATDSGRTRVVTDGRVSYRLAPGGADAFFLAHLRALGALKGFRTDFNSDGSYSDAELARRAAIAKAEVSP